jgi:hypothetical protein
MHQKDKAMTKTITLDPTTQMTETRGNVFLSAKNQYGDVELRNLTIFGIGNAESQNLNKVSIYTAEYETTPQQIQVPGQSEIAFLEKLVFIDEKTFVLTSRSAISPTVLKAIGRTFAQEEQLDELPHYRFIADAEKANMPVYAYAIRMTQKPQVFALSTAEDGYLDIQVTPAETKGKAVLSAIDANGITYLMQNLNVQTKELKKLNWSLAATVQLPEGVRPLKMVNVISADRAKVIHVFGTDNGLYRLLDEVIELVPGTEGMEIEWLDAHTESGTIFASTRNAQNKVDFLGINEIFSTNFKAFTWVHSSDMVPQTELDNVQAITGPITEINNNPGILIVSQQKATEEQSYSAYATQTLQLSAAV